MRIQRPSPALVISILALVVAMSGTAMAATSLITGKQIKDGSITSKDIANGAITQKKLQNGAVGSSKLAPGSVTAAALADRAVAPRNLATAPVTQQRAGRAPTYTPPPVVNICPNGVLTLGETNCPAIRGWVTANVAQTGTLTANVNGVSSVCRITIPGLTFSKFGTGSDMLRPVLDGVWFEPGPDAPSTTTLDAFVTWGNVSAADTTLVGTELTLGNLVNGQPVVADGLVGFNRVTSIDIDGNTFVQRASGGLEAAADQLFSGNAVACNSEASGRGAPVLQDFNVQGFFS